MVAPYKPETPFDNIESAHEYVGLLAEAIEEARAEIEEDLAVVAAGHAERSEKALRLVAYKLEKLQLHISTSRRILNDLRTLRRLLLAERRGHVASPVLGSDPRAE